jgi:hypothetical protein
MVKYQRVCGGAGPLIIHNLRGITAQISLQLTKIQHRLTRQNPPPLPFTRDLKNQPHQITLLDQTGLAEKAKNHALTIPDRVLIPHNHSLSTSTTSRSDVRSINKDNGIVLVGQNLAMMRVDFEEWRGWFR